MIYDRALTRELFDLGLRVASQPAGPTPSGRRLADSLRAVVSAQEATGKTKDCLSHVWVVPPAPAAPMIGWAIEHQDLDPERVLLHFGALLATFPFAGAVCSVIGRSLRLDGAVVPIQVRDEVRKLLGDRSTIDVGARKVATTLRYLGLLDGPPAGPLIATKRSVPAELTAWMAHAVLLTRRATAVSLDDLSNAHELAVLAVKPTALRGYLLLEDYTENGHSILAVKPAPSDAGGRLF